MRKLVFETPDIYHIDSKKKFESNKLPSESLEKTFDFAYEMCFGSGHHRSYRTGGQYSRKNGEKFSNTFQGKLSEVVLYDYLIRNDIKSSNVDYRVMGKGKWDDSDFIVNGKHLNVKSAAFFANLLLLEKEDWNSEGHYLPNKEINRPYLYDYFILVRIKPDIKKLLKNEHLFYSDHIEKERLWQLISNEEWSYDIPGFITHKELKDDVILTEHILPKNALLNASMKMDAANYYVQTGDLHPIDKLIEHLNV